MFNKNDVILFQGDSITDCGRSRETEAVNCGLGSGYANVIAADLLASGPEKQYKIINRGISGNRIVDLYARWKIDGVNLKPNVLSILIGVNDIWHEFGSKNGVEADRFDQFYRMVLDWTIKELPEIKLIICEPFGLPCGAVTDEWVPVINERREIVKKIAEDYNAVFVPFQAVFDEAMKKAPAEYWAADGVHPTIAGHKLMANVWLQAVKNSC